MRSSTAYFAGAGTVIAAIAAGLGGGYLFFSIVSPAPEKHGSGEVTRLERRASPEPAIPATSKASPEPVPYLSAPQISAAVSETPPQPQPVQPQQQQPQQAQPPQAQSQQPQSQPTQQAAAPANHSPAAQPVAAAEQPAAREKAAPEESWAKARDADFKRDARREEKRKAERERRQQWTERRKWRQRDDDGDLRDVERRVREDSEPKPLFASEPRFERIETPRIRLFGADDD